MTIKPSYRQRWKFSDDDAPYVAAFEAAAARLGFSRQRIEQSFDWYRDHGRQAGSPEKMRESFETFATGKGWGDDHVSDALLWHDVVHERGVEAVELGPAPAGADNEKRLAEIRKISAEDPQAYDSDPALQAEHMDLIAAIQGSPAAPGATPAQSAGARARDGAAAGGGDRLEEIRRMNRENPDAYNADKALQAEHEQLIAASLPAPAGAPAGGTIEGSGANGGADAQGAAE